MRLRIGTRKSPLALAQAEQVSGLLREAWPDVTTEIIAMSTSGDRIADKPLAEVGGKGLFTKELEEALLAKRIDIAVHSMKDMATVLPDGLAIGCVLEREDPRDMLVGEGLASLDDLPQGATFGTSSLRRAAQLLMKRPDIKIVPLRGNVHTRLGKIERGEMRATMLARAGLNRLGLLDIPGVSLNVDEFLPAVAQGAIAIECRADNTRIQEMLSPLADIDTETAMLCERAFLRVLDGSCRTPIAGYAQIVPLPLREGLGEGLPPTLALPLKGGGNYIHFRGLVVEPDGSRPRAVDMNGSVEHAEMLGEEAARQVLAPSLKP